MGRHQTSSGRARIALGALPLVATVGAIGVGSVMMSPASSDAPLAPPTGAGSGAGGVGTPATAVPFGSALPPAPVTVLDLAATNGAAPTVLDLPDAPAHPGSATAGRASGSGTTAAVGEVARVSASRDAATPARSGGSGGAAPSGAAASGGGSDDDGGSGGGSAGSGSDSSGGSSESEGSGRSGGGLVGGVVDGLGSTVHGTTSLLSFGESSPSVLSFD